MKKEQKLFAFKLADKATTTQAKTKQKWSARAGVATAGCSQAGLGDFRADAPFGGWDNGIYC